MKRIVLAIAGLSLLGVGARAADEKAETKTEVKRNDDGTGHTKTVKKHKHGSAKTTAKTEHSVSKDMSGGTTETKEMKSDHDSPGMSHDMKTEKKETVKRDKNGNVIKHEKSTDSK